MTQPKRSEIWLTEFDPSVGIEIKKARPALVISNDIANMIYSKITLVPITSNVRDISIAVIIEPDSQNCLDRKSLIMIPDISTFDKSRLKYKIGILKPEYMREVEIKIKKHLVL